MELLAAGNQIERYLGGEELFSQAMHHLVEVLHIQVTTELTLTPLSSAWQTRKEDRDFCFLLHVGQNKRSGTCGTISHSALRQSYCPLRADWEIQQDRVEQKALSLRSSLKVRAPGPVQTTYKQRVGMARPLKPIYKELCVLKEVKWPWDKGKKITGWCEIQKPDPPTPMPSDDHPE